MILSLSIIINFCLDDDSSCRNGDDVSEEGDDTDQTTEESDEDSISSEESDNGMEKLGVKCWIKIDLDEGTLGPRKSSKNATWRWQWLWAHLEICIVIM